MTIELAGSRVRGDIGWSPLSRLGLEVFFIKLPVKDFDPHTLPLVGNARISFSSARSAQVEPKLFHCCLHSESAVFSAHSGLMT